MRNALLVAPNQSKYLVYGTLAETVVNIALDYGLIFGHLGLPAWALTALLIASIAAEIAGMLVYSSSSTPKASAENYSFTTWQFDAANSPADPSPILAAVFQYSLSIVAWVFFYILIEHHGRQALAISNTMRNIFGLFGVFTWAFASTTNAMVSNIIGQKMEHRVVELVLKILKLSVGFSLVVALLLNVFPKAFLAVYGQDAASQKPQSPSSVSSPRPW